jgi:hypothetical protein
VSTLISLRRSLEAADKDNSGLLSRKQIEHACGHLGVSDAVQAKVLRLGSFGASGCDWQEYVVLSAALLAESRSSAVKLLFEVFSPYDDGSLPADFFLHLFRLLTKKDPAVDAGYVQDLEQHLATVGGKVTHAEFEKSPPGVALAGLE